MKNKHHFYTQEEKNFLKEVIKGRSYKEVAALFNDKFETNISVEKISSAIKRYGLKNGINGQFANNRKAWNKGISKGFSKKTEFKKGNVPANCLPIGYERITKDGYLEVKINNPNKWVAKHRLIWESYHKKIPDGSIVIFLDQNKNNLDIKNLALVSRAELLILNNNKLLFENSELSESGVLTAKLINQIRNKMKN